MRNEYRHGDANAHCDRSGFKVKHSELRPEWNGLMVRKEDWEARHPQDFVKGVKDLQAIADPRPGAADASEASETTLDAAELAGQTVISVTSTSNMTVGDTVLVFMDNEIAHLSTISSLSLIHI